MPAPEADVSPLKARFAAWSSASVVGTLCGAGAALGWAAGFVAAKHGLDAGLSPADLALHRFLWTGILLLPAVWRMGIVDLGGIGWGRGILITVLSGPGQAMLAYIGFTLVPLGHGAVIQPACAALFGLLLASAVLGEQLTGRRILGAASIVLGLLAFGAESVATIGTHGLGGDLLFAGAGIFWACFGTLLRLWRVSGQQAVAVVGIVTLVLFAPGHALLTGYGNIMRAGLAENLLQMVVQGVFAGAAAIFLFARAVILLGAGRAATFPALVPGFTLLIGYLALGNIPSVMQLVGLVVVAIGFRFTLGR